MRGRGSVVAKVVSVETDGTDGARRFDEGSAEGERGSAEGEERAYRVSSSISQPKSASRAGLSASTQPR